MHIGDRPDSNWKLIETTNKQEIKDSKKINSNFLESLSAEIRVNPAVGKGLASKVIKCIDTSQMDTKVLKDFISSLTDQQTLRGEFCTELKNKNLFVVALFNKFQESDEELLISLIDSVPHLSDTELNQLLQKAIETDKMSVAEELLKREFPIDGPLFHLACEYGMESVVMHMLKKDKELLEVVATDGSTPLTIAIDIGQESLALALIKEGANVCPSGMEELIHLACEKGLESVVMLMLEKDKKLLEFVAHYGLTPLGIAIDTGQESLALALIKAGANVCPSERKELIHIACEKGMESVVMKMLEKDRGLLESTNRIQMTPLMSAINNKQEALALALIKEGANVRSTEGKSVIHLACEKGMQSVVMRILEKNKDLLNAVNKDGRTPLIMALIGRNEAIASTLLDKKADVSIQASSGLTALHVACLTGMPNIVTRILDQDKDQLNITDKENYTPLMRAFELGNPKKEAIALMLLERGADASIGTNILGQSPIHQACELGMETVVAKIIEQDREQLNVKDKQNKPPLMYAIQSKNKSLANMIMNLDLDLKATDLEGKTVLSYACQEGMEDILSRIVKQDASLLEIKDYYGNTPLQKVINNDKREKIALLLIELGARLDTENKDGKLAIHLACEKGMKSVVTHILQKDKELLESKDSSQRTPLIIAINNKKEALALALIKAGANVHSLEGKNVMHLACERSMESVIKQILAKDKDLVNVKNDQGMTPLMTALIEGDEAIASLLLEHGADVNIQSPEGNTALHIACNYNMSNMVAKILDKDKGPLNIKNNNKETPLMYTLGSRFILQSKQESIALILLERGADASIGRLTIGGECLSNPIHKACVYGMRAVVAKIIDQDKDQLNIKDFGGATPLMKAIENENTSLANMIMNLGADVKGVDKDECSALIYAYRAEMEEIIVRLVKKDESLLEIKGHGGYTPLHQAINDKNEKMALLFIELGARLNTETDKGKLAIHLACEKGMQSILTHILATNKDLLNAINKDGRTPIIEALIGGNEDIASLLIDQGADVSIQASDGMTALHLACQYNMPNIITKILNKDKDLLNIKDKNNETPLMWVLKNRQESIALMLLEKGADVSIQASNGTTALSLACQYNMPSIITKILTQDKDQLNIKDKNNETPLIWVLRNQQESIALTMLDQGADANIRNQGKEGESPIHLACLYGMEAVVAKIIEGDKEQVNVKDKQDRTPLMHAIKSGNQSLVNRIMESDVDLKVMDQQGYTALHLACEKGLDATAFKMLEKEPELAYIYPVIDLQSNTPLQSASHKPLALELIRLHLAELTSIQSLLAEATSYNQAQAIIKNNVDKILDPTQNAPGVNPLKAAILLGDADLFQDMRVKLADRFFEHLNKLGGVPSNFIENNTLKVDPKHFAKGSLVTEAPATVDFELEKLKGFFDAINFTNPTAPGYKDPEKLTDEGRPTNPANLKKGFDDLIDRVKTRTAYTGTPPGGTPELIAFYEKFEAYLKNIGQIIEGLDDPSEKATHLIDIAIMGLHCGGKIGEASSLYRVLSGQMAEGFEEQVGDALRGKRLGIIEELAVKGPGTSYEVHRYNHYMFLMGKILQLPEADTFTQPDTFVGETIKLEVALSNFYESYNPFSLINFTERFILDIYKESRTRETCIEWIRDHVPANWEREKYQGILNKIRALEEQGVSRKEIRAEIQSKEKLFFPVADQDPVDAIKLHRQRDYNNNAPKVEEWRKGFYGPILAEIELMGETANFTQYLMIKKITKKSINTKKEAEQAVKAHRRKDHFRNKIEEEDWKKDFYGNLFKAAETIKSRDHIRRTLQEKGVELEPDRDFENLLEQVRGLEYLYTVFKYDEDEINVIGIDRMAVRNMLEQMEVIAY